MTSCHLKAVSEQTPETLCREPIIHQTMQNVQHYWYHEISVIMIEVVLSRCNFFMLADDLKWRSTTITGAHSEILINRKILLFLTKRISDTSVLTLARQHMHVIYVKHFIRSLFHLPIMINVCLKTSKDSILLLKTLLHLMEFFLILFIWNIYCHTLLEKYLH
jgi:hypothetical protein